MSRGQLRRPPAMLAVVLAVLVAVIGSTSMMIAARGRTDDVQVVPDVEEALQEAPNDAPAENYLLVGSDSREGIQEGDPGSHLLGNEEDIPGRRSDTIMVLRRERNGGAALLSLPRDLWVPISGRGEADRINSAYRDGAAVLARTVTDALGIPIQHYVEIDFLGFQALVDAIGGVEVCTEFATQDPISALRLDPGCRVLNGEEALAYARSRQLEEFIDGEWRTDPRGDIGRMERQQNFIRSAVAKLLAEVKSDPFSLDRLLGAATSSLSIDGSTDPLEAAGALRAAAEVGLETYTLPVVGTEIDDKSVVELGEGAEPILDYFRGTGPAPTTTPTSTTPG